MLWTRKRRRREFFVTITIDRGKTYHKTHTQNRVYVCENQMILSRYLWHWRVIEREREREITYKLTWPLIIKPKSQSKTAPNTANKNEKKYTIIQQYTIFSELFIYADGGCTHTHTSHGGSPAEILTMKGNFIKVHTHDQRRRVGDKIPMVYNSMMIEK